MAAYESWRLEMALHSQPDDPFPAYDTDLTPFVDGEISGGRGRPSELQSTEPGHMAVVLNNADHRFTPGNVTSPYYPHFKLARKVRLRETIGPKTYDLFTGWLELPDITDWAESGDQLITVTFVDRLTRLDRGRKLLSTLAEYVLCNGGAALKGYWPLIDASGSGYAAEATGSGLAPLSIEGNYVGAPANTIGNLIVFAAMSPTIGDDANWVQFNPVLTSGNLGVAAGDRLAVRDLAALSMTSNAYVTVAGWCKLDQTNTGSYQVLLLRDNAGVNTLQIGYSGVSGGDVWQLVAQNNAGLVTVNGPFVAWGQWQFVAARINNTTGAVDFWVDSTSWTGTCGGASTGTMDILIVDNGSPGQGAGHAQLYAGAAADFDRAKFDSQRQAAWVGLDRQTTGQRIRTIAAYAGIGSGELLVDDGVSLMQHASIAGRSPLEAMRTAETTERGVLFADGTGRLVFQDRIRRYNL